MSIFAKFYSKLKQKILRRLIKEEQDRQHREYQQFQQERYDARKQENRSWK